MGDKKFSKRSLSALVFALGAHTAAHAGEEVKIQNLELSEENQISAEEYERLVKLDAATTQSRNWGGSGSLIRAGNFSNLIRAGNFSNLIRAGNYANLIRAGNYANLVRSGNFGKVGDPNSQDDLPMPVVESDSAKN